MILTLVCLNQEQNDAPVECHTFIVKIQDSTSEREKSFEYLGIVLVIDCFGGGAFVGVSSS